ncbi:TetR/AcrR family transcriptional regulator [Rubrobacter tropicus]|uniref:TetR/AcrR family transcriptional regulator n=1 Tax=Rubrobacter tropicus TaxID=2653851 RepID=UPI00140A4718|nr:TetR/AcrR family transcriptional regulator [Rubrobacter tropicus]
MRGEGERRGGVQRRRRSPEEAERAILAAARSFLSERPFREMKVEDVMARTGLSRPAFYAYFKDRYELVTRLLEGIGGLLFAVDRRWLVGDPGVGREESREILRDALRGGAETFGRYGPVLRAISEAASYDGRVEEMYRFGLIQRLTEAVAARISRDVEAGISPEGLVPEETARALVLMTERYLIDAYGRPSDRDRVPDATVIRTLETIWLSTLYGPEMTRP